MGLFKNKKFARRLSIIFAGTLLFTTVLHGSSLTKKIDATFRGIKMFYNNQQKTVAQEPFIYNGSVYLPVRAVGELVDKTVHWDSAKNSVYLSDKGTSSNTVVSQLQSELVSKNFEIAKIKAEKSVLESKIEELEGDGGRSETSGDLRTTQKYLENNFDYEHNIDWRFKLTETSSRIYIDVSFDSRVDGSRWDRLTKREQENLFKDISREIRIDHKDVTINGKVIDSRTNNTVASFSYSRSNSFSYTQEGSSSFYDLERDLIKFIKPLDDEIDIDNIKITGDDDHITFTVVVNLDNRSLIRTWEDLARDNTSAIKDFMWQIDEEIYRDYKFRKIEGYIENYAERNQILATYDNGTLTIR